MRFSMMIIKLSPEPPMTKVTKLSHQKDEKILLPLSITVHHSTTDGYHVSCFIDDIQKMCFDAKIWLY